MKLNEDNRRGIERYDLRLLSVVHEKENGDSEIRLYTRDISSDGAFFHTGEPLPMNTKVEMTIYLPLGGSLKSRLDTLGTVVRSDSQGMAVRFDARYQISEVPEEALVS
jgi:hypothetical protein